MKAQVKEYGATAVDLVFDNAQRQLIKAIDAIKL
jgi:hypothetical protein